MKLSAHQPIYLGGYIGHFAKLAWCDQWVVMDACPMEDSGYENRNQIRVGDSAQWLTVPVRRERGQPLSGVKIATEHNWQRKHWRSIEMAYRKSKHFDRYADELGGILLADWTHLVPLDVALFKFFAEQFGFDNPMTLASNMGLEGSKSALVLDMCKKAGATEYLFGPNGREYADEPAFRAAGVGPRFQEYIAPTYPQVGGGFVLGTGVLDLLLNVGPDEGRKVILAAAQR